MKTRTLLLLALGCGIAIMLAGAVFLIQLSGREEVEPAVPIGDTATVGDMTVAVERADERGGVIDVTVRIGGVVDDDATDGFRLIASGRATDPVPDAFDGRCAATTGSVQTCVVRFDVSGADGSSRVLFYARGEDSERWVLG